MTDAELLAQAKAGYESDMSDAAVLARAKAEYESKPPREYTTGEAISDVGTAAAKGGRSGGELMTDIGLLPTNAMLRVGQGMMGVAQPEEGDNWYSDPFKRLWKGLSEDPNIEGVTMGDVTHGMFNPSGQDLEDPNYQPSRELQDTIPEGEGPAWLPAAKTAAEVGSEMIVTAPAGGAKYLVNALKAAAGATGGAVIGEQMGGETGKTVGLIGGALAADPKALWGMIKGISKVGTVPFNAIRSYLVKTDPNMAKASEAELRAGWEYAMKNVHPKDPNITEGDYMLQLERKLTGNTDAGTTGQLMDDTGLLNMERIKGDELMRRDIDIQNNLLEQQALAPLENIAPGGVTANAAKEPRNFVQTLKAQKEAQATGLEGAAGKVEEQSLVPFRDKSTAVEGAGLQKTTAKLRDQSEARNRELWAEIGNPKTRGGVIRNRVDEVFEGMTDYTKAEIKRQMGDSWNAIERMWKKGEDGKVGYIDFDGMSAAISGLSKASQDMPGSAKQVVGKLTDALYDSMAGGQAAGKRRDAANVYKQHMEKFGPRSTVGKLLDAEPEEFGKKLIGGGDAGLAKTRKLQEATSNTAPVGPGLPNAKVAAQQDDVIRGAFNKMKVNPETGRVAPESINAFMRQHGDQMSPALREEILGAQQAGRAGQEASEQAKILRKEVTDADRSTAGKFANTDDAEFDVIKRFDEVMKPGGKRSESLEELIEATGGNKQALEDLRKAGIDRLSSHITDDAGGLTVKATEKFLRDRQALEASGLYSKWELDQIQEGLKTGEKKFLHEMAKKRPKVVAAENEIFNGLFALGGAKTGAMAFGSPLIGAAIGRRIASKMAKRISSDQAEAFAYEMSVNPEIMLDMLKKFKGKKPSAEQIGELGDEMVLRATQASIVEFN